MRPGITAICLSSSAPLNLSLDIYQTTKPLRHLSFANTRGETAAKSRGMEDIWLAFPSCLKLPLLIHPFNCLRDLKMLRVRGQTTQMRNSGCGVGSTNMRTCHASYIRPWRQIQLCNTRHQWQGVNSAGLGCLAGARDRWAP